MPTTTNLNNLTINYLTQAQYDAAVLNNTINENQIYLTPSPTTLAGYGITDANIAGGVITLGNNTITPLTSSSTLDATKLSGTIPSGCYTDTNDKVSQSATTTSSWRKVLLHHTADSSGADVTTTTDVVYAAKDVEVQPSTGTIKASAFQGNASSATYASNVRITATTPTSNTTYYLTFTSGTAANTNYVLRGNSMLKAWISADGGSAQLGIGDSSHNGSIYLYSSSGKYVNIVTSAMSSENRTLTIPDVTATIFTTAGGICTGNISVSRSAPSINVYDPTNNNISAQLSVGSGHQNHGVYSNGYAPTASTFTSSAKWIIYRGSDGEAHSQLKIYGAVFNDYAEYRTTKNYIEPGRCIIETGNDDLILSTTRLQPGAEIVSDTFGFAIGQTKTSNTPIASNGRVLAYIYEGREAAKNAIGKPVCSGPNGTVSIMTDEEYQKYGYCAIGTISSVPSYETWGTDNIKVNGRIWIRIK